MKRTLEIGQIMLYLNTNSKTLKLQTLILKLNLSRLTVSLHKAMPNPLLKLLGLNDIKWIPHIANLSKEIFFMYLIKVGLLTPPKKLLSLLLTGVEVLEPVSQNFKRSFNFLFFNKRCRGQSDCKVKPGGQSDCKVKPGGNQVEARWNQVEEAYNLVSLTPNNFFIH